MLHEIGKNSVVYTLSLLIKLKANYILEENIFSSTISVQNRYRIASQSKKDKYINKNIEKG